MIIQVDTVQLIEKSNQIRMLREELLSTMDQLELLVLSLEGDWQGESGLLFAERILSINKEFTHIADFFDDYAELLKSFAYAYEQQEADITSKINLT